MSSPTPPAFLLTPRHIQNYSDAKTLEPHWGYAMRALPCKSDPGTCEYLDVDYSAHDRGMLYVGILWATIVGILFAWAIWRQASRSRAPGAYASVSAVEGGESESAAPPRRSAGSSALVRSFTRRHLLPRNSFPTIFGHASRLQLLILATLLSYLTLWSFLGITYKTWRTPVASHPGTYQTRTSLGPWSDRVGVLAFALLPFTIMLASRESLLSLITGVPYQHFNFLHRWLGHVIFAQSALHTIAWCIIELRLYQPQPSVGAAWVKQNYIIWGIVAMALLLALWVLALPVTVRWTGYEFFRKAHYVLAMVFIGACWGHWKQLECFLIPSFVLWGLDRAARLLRTALIHYYHRDGADEETTQSRSRRSTFGFSTIKAHARLFPSSRADEGDIVRLDFTHRNPASSFKPGQHFFLTFPESSIWQSHPFTPVCSPLAGEEGEGSHCYVFRAKGGETAKLARLARERVGRLGEKDGRGRRVEDERVSVVLSGPYGQSVLEEDDDEADVLCVAGGTGITFVLPVLLRIVAENDDATVSGRRLKLVWVVRHLDDVSWLQVEIDSLREGKMVDVEIHVTRDDDEKTGDVGRPAIDSLVSSFTSTARPTSVFGSGPAGMLDDLREAVAGCEGRKEVRLVCDDRLEW